MAVEGPYTDTGTGAHPGPPAEVTYTQDHDQESTGAVKGPPAEVTVTSPAGEDVTKPTGAHPGPPAESTSYQWPAEAPKTKRVKADDPAVEDKMIGTAHAKRTGR